MCDDSSRQGGNENDDLILRARKASKRFDDAFNEVHRIFQRLDNFPGQDVPVRESEVKSDQANSKIVVGRVVEIIPTLKLDVASAADQDERLVLVLDVKVVDCSQQNVASTVRLVGVQQADSGSASARLKG